MSKVLIVVDMQNDFVYGCLGTEEARKIVPKVVKKIREFDGKILYTMDTHGEDYLKTQEGRNLPVEHCIIETEGWEVINEIKSISRMEKDFVFQKGTFGSKQLAETLLEQNQKEPIRTIELIGVCTDICVISNAILIKAFLPETEVLVDAACCAGVNPDSHKNALKAMAACQIKVIE